jgi:ribosomal protein S18 acetylase RimI-like enzyme
LKRKSEALSIQIREFRLEDYNALITLWKKAGLSHRPGGRDSRDSIEMELKRGHAVFLLAEYGGYLVGSVLGTHDGRKGWINRVAVDPEYQRKGIAGLLVEEAERRLAELGIEIIACLIEDWNLSSMQFFKKLGYVKHPDILYFSKRNHADV